MRRQARAGAASLLLSVPDAAGLLGVDPSTLYRAIQRGDTPLPVVRIGRRLRIPRRSVEALLHGGVVEAAQSVGGTETVVCGTCPACGAVQPAASPVSASAVPSRRRPTCTAARRSASGNASV